MQRREFTLGLTSAVAAPLLVWPGQAGAAQIGQAAHAIGLKDTAGETVRLESFKYRT